MNTQRSRGFVLVFAILLLLVMTLIGISIMSGSQMQERMSGNARLQSLAFQAATAGVADAVSFVKDVNVLAPGLICGGSNLAEWEAGWLDKTVSPHRPRPTDWFPRAGNGEPNVEILSRLYCLWDAGEDQGRSHLYVESQGIVRTAGQVVANRSVEVRVVSGRDSTLGDPTCAIQALCVPAQENPLSAFNPPASQASFVGGDTGHAICACSDSMRQTIVDRIRPNRQGSFSGVGGIGAAAIQGANEDGTYTTRSPFDDLNTFVAFIEALRQIAIADGTFSAGGHSEGFNWANQVRFVDGDLYAAGGNSGSGILVVTGDIELRGNFRYDGLVIGMGSILGLKGSGGQVHGVRGSVVAAPVDLTGPTVGTINLSFHEPGPGGGAGAGGVSYAFDCDALKSAEQLLSDSPAAAFWQANCDGGIENIFTSGPAELQLVSWRENLGWREQDNFFSTRVVLENN